MVNLPTWEGFMIPLLQFLAAWHYEVRNAQKSLSISVARNLKLPIMGLR